MVRRDLVSRLALVALAIVAVVAVACSSSRTPAPTADFSVSYVSGELLLGDPIASTAPLTVQFNDQSTGEVTSWRWNLGDGTVIEGSGGEFQAPVHTYTTENNGYVVSLTVRGPGGKDQKVKWGIVSVLSCSEAANAELNQARKAIQDCMSAAGQRTALNSDVEGWDGSPGKVIADSIDAADYLGVWKTFKATYRVEANGYISSGTDLSWGCIRWNNYTIPQPRWDNSSLF